MTDPAFDRPPGFEALFDLSFTRLVNVSVIKIIYLLGILMIAIGWLIFIGVSFFEGGFGAGVGALIVGTIAAIIYLLLLRVWLELIVVLFRIGENTSAMARSMGATPPTGGFPVTPIPPAPAI